MRHGRNAWRAAAVTGLAVWSLATAASPADAHPLGNFSINHYTGFTVRSDRLDVLAVTDTAEIPTLQAATTVDTDGDGHQSSAERAAWASAQCTATARKLNVGTPRRLTWTTDASSFTYHPGQAGLRTSRLECRLHASLDLSHGPTMLRVDTGMDATRVGWNEITAKGMGAHLRESTVPTSSVSDELRRYPRDLLTTPLGDTRARFTALAGKGSSDIVGTQALPGSGQGLTGRIEAMSRHLTSLAGAKRLTVPVGLLALLLSIVLGAGHAMLPGHGKTVMAAYLAGRQGRTRDALTVGATVTLTHTAGVLVIGLCLTTFSSLAGDTVLNWLGVASGALVAVVGAGLLTSAARRYRRTRQPVTAVLPAHARQPSPAGAPVPSSLLAAQSHAAATPMAHHTHAHPHGHEHGVGHPHSGDHGHPHTPAPGHSARHPHPHTAPHRHGLFGHTHTHDHTHAHSHTTTEGTPFTTGGLVGLGIAGGLVPSPSALVVLLGAIALGRTIFGATLVLAYGLGMAATLTAVGLILVRLNDQAKRLGSHPVLSRARRLAPYTAVLTATLVLVVGLGMIARSLPSVL